MLGTDEGREFQAQRAKTSLHEAVETAAPADDPKRHSASVETDDGRWGP